MVLKKEIKLLLAFSNDLISEGLTSILRAEEGLSLKTLDYGLSPVTALDAFCPDVVLLDFITLCNTFTDIGVSPSRAFLLIDTECGEENIVSAILVREVAGVLMGDSTPDMLVKAIRAVAAGEVWVERKTVRNLLAGMRSTKQTSVAKLSDRELQVVALVAQGFRNKEIASRLAISEPTVKTHLYRIFRKLGIQNRPQLIVYALKNQIV